jgi:VWFA-related protein
MPPCGGELMRGALERLYFRCLQNRRAGCGFSVKKDRTSRFLFLQSRNKDILLLILLTATAAAAQQQNQNVPDGPAPQKVNALSDMKGKITPGKGESYSSSSLEQTAAPAQTQEPEQPPPDMPPAGQGPGYIIPVRVNFVEVPVTVKDQQGHLVSGLTWRDFRIFENRQQQRLQFFTVDPFPLSIVYIIDQTISSDAMRVVNDSLSAVAGSLAAYDEAAVITYNNGPNTVTDFTGAQSERLTAALQSAKRAGRDVGGLSLYGPMSAGMRINGRTADPTVVPPQSNNAGYLNAPKEVHALNDAIFAAAQLLSTRPKGRHRIIYVIGEGKEQGSKLNQGEVIRYLQSHQIVVYATTVGESATWGVATLERRIHIPLQASNVLPRYIMETGGSWEAELSTNSIERSYFRLSEEARNRYTLGYYTHEPLIDGKYRAIEVRVLRPGLDVIARQGFYPSAQDVK